MQTFLEQILNGLTLGSMYALVSAGLALTVGVLRVVNFAHGDLFMLGSYVFYFIYIGAGLPYPVAAVATIIVMAGIGFLFQRLVIRPIITRSWQVQLVATMAASVVINNAVIWLLGSQPKTTPTTLSRTTLQLGSFMISWQRVLIMVCTAVIFAALHQFLKRSRLGKAMRAVSQNREAAESVGIDLPRIATLTFVLGAVLIGIGNALVTPVFSVFPAMGMLITVKGFAVMTVGGFGRVNGAIIAGFLLGMAEVFGTGYLNSAYTDGFAFIAMILVLLFAPHGLFGKKVGI